MNQLFKTFVLFFLLFSTVFIVSCSNDDSTNDDPDLTTLSTLLLTQITRPDLTDATIFDILTPTVESAAQTFIDSLSNKSDPTLFLEALPSILQTYTEEYQNAPADLDGAEAKGIALDHLYGNVLGAAEQAGISLQEFKTAFLSSFASIETNLDAALANGTISEFDFELVKLLMVHTVNDLTQRGYYRYLPAEMVTLGTDQAYIDYFAEQMAFAPENFVAFSISLENGLANPDFGTSTTSLIQIQFNDEAMRDLVMARFVLFLSYSQIDINQIIERMKAMGGIMTGMTGESFCQAGFGTWSDDTCYLPLQDFVAFDWVTPDRPAGYTPSSTLAVELQQLGENVPVSPNFSILSGPYLATAQLIYDFDLCFQIYAAEWKQANDEYMAQYNKPIPMDLRLQLHEDSMARRQQVLDSLMGATSEEKQALDLWLTALSR